MKSKATKYKQRIINIWNEVAPFYHNRWAKNEIGPFSVTNDLIKSARIKSGYTVLDLACGTGLVTKKILSKVTCGNGTMLKNNICVVDEMSFYFFVNQFMRFFG